MDACADDGIYEGLPEVTNEDYTPSSAVGENNRTVRVEIRHCRRLLKFPKHMEGERVCGCSERFAFDQHRGLQARRGSIQSERFRSGSVIWVRKGRFIPPRHS